MGLSVLKAPAGTVVDFYFLQTISGQDERYTPLLKWTAFLLYKYQSRIVYAIFTKSSIKE